MSELADQRCTAVLGTTENRIAVVHPSPMASVRGFGVINNNDLVALVATYDCDQVTGVARCASSSLSDSRRQLR